MNHRSNETIEQSAKEYSDAFEVLKSKGVPTASCSVCVDAQVKIKIFKEAPANGYAPLDSISSDTAGPISTADICGNKFLQLLVNAATGWTMGEPMQKKSGASDVIHKYLARLQLVCNTKVKRFHTDGSQEQYNARLNKILEEQGTVKSTTAPNFSLSNAFVERRIGVIFSAARLALKAAPKALNSTKHWSLIALDAVDKSNFLPITRDGIHIASPHTQMQLHGHEPDEKEGPGNFLPFGQPGWIVNTNKYKRKFDDRAHKANYLRCINKTHIKYTEERRRILQQLEQANLC